LHGGRKARLQNALSARRDSLKKTDPDEGLLMAEGGRVWGQYRRSGRSKVRLERLKSGKPETT